MSLPAEFSWFLPVLAAPFIGSFIGLVAHRLPHAEPIVFDRSVCTSCHKTLSARDLVPLISWLATRGRCRHCDAPVSARYPLTELAALIVAIWAVSVLSGIWSILIGCLLGWALLTLTLVDLREKMLPDAITLPLIAIGLAAALILEPLDPLAHLIGAILGLTLFLAVGATFRRIKGYDGLGGGDAKLFAAAGAWVGWAGLPSVLLIASVTALAVVLVIMVVGRRNISQEEIAFGPYLCFGFWIVWLYGPLVII
ncbi:MAG: prepilin peptidase [Alphaproteobacteria bacterium]|nr:prepilin peptidase [Alphaproteobacteria bacterium]